MAEWEFTQQQIMDFPDEVLNNMLAQHPLQDSFLEKQQRCRAISAECDDVATEKARDYRVYKEALAEFKRVSVNADGSKAKMNPEIRRCRDYKEETYRIYKATVEREKRIKEEYATAKIAENQAYVLFFGSMERFMLLEQGHRGLRGQRDLQRQRAQRRREIDEYTRYFMRLTALERQTLDDYMPVNQYRRNNNLLYFRQRMRNGRPPRTVAEILEILKDSGAVWVSPPKEDVVQLSKAESEVPMDDVCIICMEAHPVGETVLTCCGHRFGTECFEAWRKQRVGMGACSQCAMCKKDSPSITKYEVPHQMIDLTC